MAGSSIALQMGVKMNMRIGRMRGRRDRSSLTAQNAALREAAARYFVVLRQEHPEWTREDALKAIGAPDTSLFHKFAREAGFQPRTFTQASESEIVSALVQQGVWSPRVITEESGISEVRVCQILSGCPAPYGIAPYGSAPYGNNRNISDGCSWVARKINVNGQLSYRGHLYCLGKDYRGRYALVKEEKSRLIVVCKDRPRIELAVRHYLEK